MSHVSVRKKLDSTSPVGPSLTVKFISAGLGACTADLATFPLDVAKVRLQVQGEAKPAVKPEAVAVRPAPKPAAPPLHVPAPVPSVPKPHMIPTIESLYHPQTQTFYANLHPQAATISQCRHNNKAHLLKTNPCELNKQLRTSPHFGLRSFSLKTPLKAPTASVESAASVVRLVGKTAISHEEKVVFAKTAIAKKKYRGLFGTMRTIAKEEGFRGLYGGISPGLQRQLVFATIRVGTYDSVRDFYTDQFRKYGRSSTSKDDAKKGPNLAVRIAAGLTTGAVAMTCAQPTDVVKIRMQANRKAYKSSPAAYKKIWAFEGLRGLWRGLLPNVARNSVISCCELVSYDVIKEQLLKWKFRDNLGTHVIAGSSAGFIATVIGSPIDVLKTRIMNSPPGAYNGIVDCTMKMFREAGPLAFYKGFVPSVCRISSWNVVMFVAFEQYKTWFSTPAEVWQEKLYHAQHSDFQVKHRSSQGPLPLSPKRQ